MKSIILFLISMVFLFGCQDEITESQRPPDTPYPFLRYIKVMTESGEPCISAMAEIDSSEFSYMANIDSNHFYADSNGVIKAVYIFPKAYFVSMASFITIVHQDTSKPWIIWTENILYESEYSYSINPLPPHEVVFPDSP